MRRAIALLAVALLAIACARDPGVPPGLAAAGSLPVRDGPVWQVAFSPDGTHLAAAGVDGAVQVWRFAERELERTLSSPAGLTSVAYSGDGRHIAAGSYDGKVRIWDASSGATMATLAAHAGTVWSVAFAPDGRSLASSGEDRRVILWNVADGNIVHEMRGHERNVWSVRFSPDGARLASGSFDRTAKLWRVADGALEQTLRGHGEAIVEVAFSPDGSVLATGGDDSTVRLWSLPAGEPQAVLAAGGHVYALAFTRDGRLAGGGREHGPLGTLLKHAGAGALVGHGISLRFWTVPGGAPGPGVAAGDDVHSIDFSPGGGWMATSGERGEVRLWRVGGK